MKRKAGRPAKYGERMKDYRLRLAKHHAETFRNAGEGNMSAGARTLAEEKGEEMNKGKKAGMTLIEILVVVGICAILAAMALTVYSRCREPARDVSLRERVHQCSIAMLAEYPQTARIPTTNGEADTYAAWKRTHPYQDMEQMVEFVEFRTADSIMPTHETRSTE